jgi:hypothetical protein
MAKKQDDANTQGDPAPNADPRAPIESEWAGLTKWTCPFCPRDSFDRADVVAHIRHAHPEPGLSVPEAIAANKAAPATTTQATARPASARATEQPAETPEKGEG